MIWKQVVMHSLCVFTIIFYVNENAMTMDIFVDFDCIFAGL